MSNATKKSYNLAWLFSMVLWTALAYTYGHLLFSAFFRYGISFDFLAYHLPGALQLVGLTTFEPGPKMSLVLAGFPPLAHFTQGALVWLTGLMAGATAHSALLFVLACLILKRQFGKQFSLQWFLVSCLAVPLFIMHFALGYIDLFTGIMLMLTFIGLELVAAAKTTEEFNKACIFYGLAGAGAMLCKLQAWPIVFFTTIFFFGNVVLRVRREQLGVARALAVLAVTAAALAIWPTRNLIYFSNPTYPFSAPFMKSAFAEAPVPIDEAGLQLQLPEALWEKPLGYRFIFSLLELNRLKAPGYKLSYDLNAEGGHHNIHHRMGGFFPVTVICLLLITLAAYRRRMITTTALAAFGTTVLFLMNFLPANHELRYWFFIPLTLAFWTSRYLAQSPHNALSRITQVALIATAGYFCLTIPHVYDWSKPSKVTDWSHPAAQSFWQTAKADETNFVCGAIPYAIYWAGPTFNEYPVKDQCL
jgi:hypothetical protein